MQTNEICQCSRPQTVPHVTKSVGDSCSVQWTSRPSAVVFKLWIPSVRKVPSLFEVQRQSLQTHALVNITRRIYSKETFFIMLKWAKQTVWNDLICQNHKGWGLLFTWTCSCWKEWCAHRCPFEFELSCDNYQFTVYYHCMESVRFLKLVSYAH